MHTRQIINTNRFFAMKKETKTAKKSGNSIVPLHDRVLLREIDENATKTQSGIYLPETVDQDKGIKKGKVIAVGAGRYDDGKIVPMNVKVGDTVLFTWGDKITVDGEDYYMVREGEISALIN